MTAKVIDLGRRRMLRAFDNMIAAGRAAMADNAQILIDALGLTDQELRQAAPMLFRWHRGGFDDSMATAFAVESLRELVCRLRVEIRDGFRLEPVRLEFRHSGIDERNGWNTWDVDVVTAGDERPYCIGMINFDPGTACVSFLRSA